MKITYAVLCIIGATLIILKNADRAWTYTYSSTAMSPGSNHESRGTLVSLQIDFPGIIDTVTDDQSDNEYEPPNYGGPDVSYGSGTR